MKAQAPSSSIFVTGMGAVSCAGLGAEALWRAVLNDQTQIKESLGRVPSGVLEEISLGLSMGVATPPSAPTLLAYASAREAMRQAGWSGLQDGDGLIVATTAGQIPLWENELVRFSLQEIDAPIFAKAIVHQPLGSIAEALADLLEFRGRSLVVASACSAATQAIGVAAQWIKQGRVRRCLVGGTEILSRLTVEGFRSLQLLSPEASAPFDRDRQGINLSEGAAFLCLESASLEAADRFQALARISGCGLTTDAYHMASPHPEGQGCYRAMQTAIRSASLTPSDIDWVHAHGTGSRANDQAEGFALSRLFSETGGEMPWVTSTKWAHGHALGASGAIEAVVCIQALRHQKIPRTGGLKNPDPGISIRHPKESLSIPLRHVLKNTLGFGGNNAALVISA